jgi:Mg-chelatase subunit ChlD
VNGRVNRCPVIKFDPVCVAESPAPKLYSDCALDMPPVDDRCADPAFAEANPDLCRYFARLIIKNEYCDVVVDDEATFKAFAIANGKESALTAGITFASSDESIATIDASTGVATAVAAGIATISVLWDGQYAFAQMNVVASCVDATQFLVLIDNSSSMGQNFNAAYPTKLHFAKVAVKKFIDKFNRAKDSVAVGNFNTEGDVNQGLSTVIADLKAGVDQIIVSDELTDLADAIEHGADYLIDNAAGKKVLILVTDGQQTYGKDPRPLARAFKEQGGLVVVLAVRAFGNAFQVCNEISSKGFMVSAYGSNAATAITNFVGLKSFICSGDCPDGTLYGCLTTPLAAQVADPSPLPLFEE